MEKEAERQKRKLELEQKRRLEAAKRAEARRAKKELEHINKVTRMDLPLDYVNAFAEDERANEHCETLYEGLLMSLDLLGMVDIEFISSVTGEDFKAVIEGLKGTIYQNPLYWNEIFYKGWETADEYLLELLGAYTSNEATKNTTYLIVGAEPGRKKLSMALMNETKIITEGQFAKMIGSCEIPNDEGE